MKLRRWFPPNDRFAATVARLCILREDFALEMQGIYVESIRPLDSHAPAWRRMYFWRNLVRTLLEIRKALETLNTIPEFKKALRKSPKVWQEKFAQMTKKLKQAETLVEETRNLLGGHVLQRGVEKALDNMDVERWGFIEAGRTLKQTHYKFAGELVGEILLAGVPEEKRMAELETHFQTIADLLPVYELSDIILTIYADHRRLVD